MKKIIAVLFAVVGMQYASFAENSHRTFDFTHFTGISVTDNFNVVLKSGAGYSVSMDVDARLYDYCNATLQGSTLNINVDEKSFPKELKSQLKKASEDVILNVVVTVPAGAEINSINAEDNSTIDISTAFSIKGKMAVTLDNNAKLFGLNVSDASKVEINTSKKSQLDGNVNCKNLIVKTSNNSNVRVDAKCSKVEINAGGSSDLVISGSSDEIEVNASNSAKVNLGGSVNVLKVNGKGNSDVNAGSLKAVEAVVELNSSKCTVAPGKKLSVSIQSNSTLVFDGNPEIDIVKIQNSSVLRAADVKTNKR